jgi:hypothetical protein
VSPGAKITLPVEDKPSHYYAARQTDAAPLQAGTENEKFLFYRGVADVPLPVSTKATQDGNVIVTNTGNEPVQGAILFENRSGHSRYTLLGTIDHEITIDRESLQGDKPALLADLKQVLVSQGLYEKEAAAMLATWRDSWFEEGTRLFYIVPPQVIDSVLPLDIQPVPSETTRVYVGRMEIITPEIQEDVRLALAHKDNAALDKYGRFLESIKQRIGAK